jgi:hypothetical protein
MTDREAFLARWSRRKREAGGSRAEPLGEKSAAPPPETETPEAPSAEPVLRPEPEPQAELPSVDSIDSTTDIRAFLKEGVPQDLTRDALRRAWSSDPAIRDFVGLSENAWDFTAPEGVPGFGPFAPDAARELVAQMFGETKSTSGADPSVAAAVESGSSADEPGHAERQILKALESDGAETERSAGGHPVGGPVPRAEHTAMQQQAADPEPAASPSRPPDAGLPK